MPPSPAAMDVEEDASNTGPKNTTSNSVEEAKRNNLEISQSVIICISDLAFKYAGIVPDLFVLKRSVCIFKRSYTFLISCVLKEGDEGA
ncbi:hypothetical protein HanRHA438_Chr14g0639121 [Helianthus annuus]|uniref:Uncharacterized protein n=1 Tax=Helianthus annuus TaxID=4232 RepID=A0A9K3E6E4_HELAN|nr:hypothetical protein HanXRQr2_Chr14g0627931 [Helianthus annuus]KAJ0467083.1 hypothetical protein HanIR_Chr14g0681331 [Helianthus annuus]KAJ0817903.1 hypothetical protein HanLR1_Chr00c0391g0748251 [Helianthus annuus]KAJ0852382.1 hypothetical protein HanRHA438_Chr14g0639121 [Helianthus annuus]